MIELETKALPRFELNLIVRNAQGQPTGRRTSIKTDDANKLWAFFIKHQGPPKRKRKKDKEKLPSATQAEKVLRDIYEEV